LCRAGFETILVSVNGTTTEAHATSKAIEILETAMRGAAAGRPKVEGFPYLAETLRRAGVSRNFWHLPVCQILYLREHGPVVALGTPFLSGMVEVPGFNREVLVAALRTDQAGKSTVPEFLLASRRAGVPRYDVDLHARTCPSHGANEEEDIESCPVVEVG
jgi:uncharacterized protein YbcV (DUF1398 family)